MQRLALSRYQMDIGLPILKDNTFKKAKITTRQMVTE